MARKVLARVWKNGSNGSAQILAWCQENTSAADVWASNLNAEAWAEAEGFAESHTLYAAERLQQIGIDLGGGGHYAMLYFLVRHFRPDAVLETGVAAGHSSRAVLTAMKCNDHGALFSSDFPYFRLKNPERFIGILVEDELKQRWTLKIKGDAVNLPELVRMAPPISLFHYDSDKTDHGRQHALAHVEPHLTDDAIIVFDDIQDTDHFQNLVKTTNRNWKVFHFGGKYLGVLLPS
ncbi:MAG: class I SAM-dependent methyltransferase [Hyphomicrobiales bacterium]